MVAEKELIKKCLNNDSVAQELLYRRYASKMYGVCLRYARSKDEADDILQDGFIKVFASLDKFREEGSFEGWIRRIMVNTAITYYRKNLKFKDTYGEEAMYYLEDEQEDSYSKLSLQELLNLVQSLPEGYRLVFNLYVMEGYSHQEISVLLNITTGTSKSQLARARMALQEKIEKQKHSYI